MDFFKISAGKYGTDLNFVYSIILKLSYFKIYSKTISLNFCLGRIERYRRAFNKFRYIGFYLNKTRCVCSIFISSEYQLKNKEEL